VNLDHEEIMRKAAAAARGPTQEQKESDELFAPYPRGTAKPPPGSRASRIAPPVAERYKKLAPVSGAAFQGKPVPQRKFVIPEAEMIPSRTVSTLSADGGTGKSLIALQLAAAIVTGRTWLNMLPISGPVVFLTAEDELDEVHRRLDAICAHEGIRYEELSDLHILPFAGRAALLATFNTEQRQMLQTDVLGELQGFVAEVKPRLVILDTVADVFGGNEIDRAQVRQFVGMLRGLALRGDTAVLMLAHPSLTGLSSGSGSSGSTAWHNSVRSRLYLERAGDEDGNGRVLTTKKANYGPTGGEIRIRWHRGVFVRESSFGTGGAKAGEDRADAIFLAMLREYTEQGRTVSPNPSAAFAPTRFARDQSAKGMTKGALTSAMNRLLRSGAIKVEAGPRGTSKLVPI
jgi:RecA-family ATPase